MTQIPFCELCGKILQTKNANEKIIGTCSCGFTIELNQGFSASEKIPEKEEIGEGAVVEDKSLEGFPHDCPKCSHTGCEVFDLGAPYSDESNVYLYKCKKCGHVDRQADGTSNM
jgi:DNA-directed RNA polymerase subunit M/transcription elongation factor TFIIS